MVVLKCHLGSDTRRIRLDNISFDELTKDILPKMYSEDISQFHITYLDPDNDTIFITSEDELKEAFNLCQDMLIINLIRKRKNSKDETSGQPLKKPRLASTTEEGQWRQNSMPVRLMVIEALKSLPNGGTIHDIMDFVNEQFPSESKNLKDLNRSIQALLSSRKEFTKAPFKQVDKLTKKECTVWTLSNQKGIKKVQKQHKQHRGRGRKKGGQSEDEPGLIDEGLDNDALDDREDEEELSDEDGNHTKQEVNPVEIITMALKGLQGKASVQDIREWIISHHPEHWTLGYKLPQILSSEPSLFVEEQQDGASVWKLVKPEAQSETQSPGNSNEDEEALQDEPEEATAASSKEEEALSNEENGVLNHLVSLKE